MPSSARWYDSQHEGALDKNQRVPAMLGVALRAARTCFWSCSRFSSRQEKLNVGCQVHKTRHLQVTADERAGCLIGQAATLRPAKHGLQHTCFSKTKTPQNICPKLLIESVDQKVAAVCPNRCTMGVSPLRVLHRCLIGNSAMHTSTQHQARKTMAPTSISPTGICMKTCTNSLD